MTIQERIDDVYFGLDVGDDMGMNPSDAAAFNAQLTRVLALVKAAKEMSDADWCGVDPRPYGLDAVDAALKELLKHGDIPAETTG